MRHAVYIIFTTPLERIVNIMSLFFYFQGSENCTKCANFQDGLFCVSRCPQGVLGEDDMLVWKYADERKVCQLCHKNCTQG